jgi:hypothetical protein
LWAMTLCSLSVPLSLSPTPGLPSGIHGPAYMYK